MDGYESRMKGHLKHFVKILHELAELSWFQAGLQFRLGDPGLKIARQHHEIAFASSLTQCKFRLIKVCSDKVQLTVENLI